MTNGLTIAVCLKQVPDVRLWLDLDPSGMGIDPYDLAYEMNPNDRVALAEALRVRNQSGGKVIGLTVGPNRAQAVLETSLAMGVDRAVWIPASATATSHLGRVAAHLCEAIRPLRPDLVLCGFESADEMRGAVGIQMASRLGYPSMTSVAGIEVVGEPQCELRVARLLGNGLVLRADCSLPALLTFAPWWAFPLTEELRASQPAVEGMLGWLDGEIEVASARLVDDVDEEADPWRRGCRLALFRRKGQEPQGPPGELPAAERIDAIYASTARLRRHALLLEGSNQEKARRLVDLLRKGRHLPPEEDARGKPV